MSRMARGFAAALQQGVPVVRKNRPGRDERARAFVEKRAPYVNSQALPPRTTPIRSPEEVAEGSARLRRFAVNSNRLVLKGPDDEVLDGPVLVEKLDQFRARSAGDSSDDEQQETEQCEGAISFTVGARSFGKDNRLFIFPNGYQLIKQSAFVYTVADNDTRVTLAWKLDNKAWVLVKVTDVAARRKRLKLDD